MERKLKVGIIGAGWIANHHIYGYITSNRAEIVAISDVKEETAREIMNKYGLNCKFYKNYLDLLSDSEVEAVSICAPNKFHTEITVAAAEHKKDILCEKPFVSSIDDAISSYRAIKKNGVKCAVGYHRRFNPLYQEMKKLKKEGKLGNIYFCQSDYVHHVPMSMPIMKWALKKEFNPCAFHAGAGHCVDTLRYLIGSEIIECAAFMGTESCPGHESQAEAVAIYKFANGAIGKVMQIAPSPIANFEFNVEVYGTKGTFKNNKLLLDTFPNFWEPENAKAVVTYPDWIPNNTRGITEPWDVEIHKFVDWILSGKDETDLCLAIDAIKVAEACWAAVRSAEEGKFIKLPLINYNEI